MKELGPLVVLVNSHTAAELSPEMRATLSVQGVKVVEIDPKELAYGKAILMEQAELDSYLAMYKAAIMAGFVGPPADPAPPMEPESILLEAERIVNGPRQNDYGHPLDNWTRAAKLWSPILGIDVTAEQALLCMVQVKVARLLQTANHRDSQVDVPGYMLAYNKTVEERKRRMKEIIDTAVKPECGRLTGCAIDGRVHNGNCPVVRRP